MSTPFQNRLVGTVIIAAAAVIFLPDILSGKKEQNQTVFEDIPQAPNVVATTNETSFPEEKLALVPKSKMDKTTALRKVFDDKQNIIEPESEQANEKIVINTAKKEEPLTPASQVAKTKSEGAPSVVDKAKVKAESVEQWVVQLGSYSQKKNVDELVNLLEKNGFKAFTKPITTKMGKLTKVFVGPEVVKSVLEKKLPELKALTKVEGKVSTYRP